MIKSYGGPAAMPRKRAASGDGGEKLVKMDYVTSLVDLLRALNGNDYSPVAKLLQEESSKGGAKKGFGGGSAAGSGSGSGSGFGAAKAAASGAGEGKAAAKKGRKGK